MKLQQRFILSTFIIFFISLIVGFILANILYIGFVRENVDERYFSIVDELSTQIEEHNISFEDTSSFLESMSELGYQIVLISEDGQQFSFGQEFKKTELNDQMRALLRSSELYHGVRSFNGSFFMMSHFSNNIQNTVGKSVTVAGEKYGLFLRTSNTSFFTEFHLIIFGFIFAILVVSIIGIILITRKLIKNLTQLTRATNHIANQHFDYELTINSKDEIGQLAMSFRQMQQKLAHTDTTRKKFMNNVSHDFQSPLLNILGYSELLDAEVTSENGKMYNAIIQTEAKRLSNLTKQLLVLTSIDEGTYPLQKSDVRVDKQLHEVIRSLHWRIEEKQLEIALHLQPTTVYGDKTLLMNCWENLISNAIKYNKVDGSIKIQCYETDYAIQVIIEDGGIGIEEESITQIFDRFYRVDKARNKEGMGLGLAIVHEALTYHSGTIHVQSEVTVGTTFTVTIPKQLNQVD